MLKLIYFIFSLLSLFNGAWMLFFPLSWYTDLPAAVPNTGPFNSHFVRDLGVVFLLVGLAFGWSTLNVDRSGQVHLALTAFFTGHALIHVTDILAGRLPHSHWLVDLAGVFAPALIMIILAVPSVRRRLGGT
jgi:ABC-type branched-subunit amino acid transport system permease subunit